jgi:hypothetical protein
LKKTRVVFVGGYGRSGSTIIDLLLNRVPGIVAVGEFRHLFGRALGDNELCSCSKPFRDCEFWSKVLTEAFPGDIKREQIQAAVKYINRLVILPQLAFPFLMTKATRNYAGIYAAAFEAAYQAVAKVSGASAIVDSTKYPVHGWFLRTLPSLDLRVMLLVRDPRAVAYSWERRRLRPEIHWERREMPRYNVVRSALAWNLSNDITARLKKHVSHYKIQCYEDFVANPTHELSSIASFTLGRTTSTPQDLFEKQPRTPHTIAGNPIRIGSEQVRIRDDDEWRIMPLHKRLLVDLFCLGGMRRYGYRLRIK